MDLRAAEGVASRFKAYIEHLRNAVGHADRREPLVAYCAGLLLPGERKSVEPMAARLAPEEVSAKHQSLHHFVAKAPWKEAALRPDNEYFVGRVGHAEESLLTRASDSWQIVEGGTSRNICKVHCAWSLGEKGLGIGGPPFRGWSNKTRFRMFWRTSQ